MSSSVAPGTLWQLSEFLSPARLNRKTILHDTAANLDTLTDVAPNTAVIPTTSNSNWTQDVLYIRNSAGTAWISASGGVHLHDSASAASGGLFSDILFANQSKVAWDNLIHVTASDFVTESASSGNIQNDPTNSRLTFNSGSTSGNYVAGARYGVPISFDGKSIFRVRMMVSNANNITVRAGITSERVDQTANTIAQKYGIEACDSAGNPMDWSLYTADGATRGAQTATSYSVANGAQSTYRLTYTPGTSVTLHRDSTLAATRTGTVPLSGNIVDSPRNIGIGVRTNTGAARTLYLTGMSYVGRINHSTW